MKLHSPGFEKTLRRRVRQTIKSSRELKREYRAARKFRKQYQLTIIARPLVSVGVAFAVWHVLAETSHLSSASAVIALWSFMFVFLHAQRLRTSLYAAGDLPAFTALPIPESTVFRWEVQRFFLGALWALGDLLAGYAALALHGDFSFIKWFAVLPFSLVTWIETIALAALCILHFPRFPYPVASSLFVFSIFIGAAARKVIGPLVIKLIDSCAPGLNVILPTAWPVSLFQALLFGQGLTALGFLVPTALVIWSLRNSLQRLAGDYRFQEQVLPEAADLVPEAEETKSNAGNLSAVQQPTRLGPTAIEEIIQTRQFLSSPDWHRRGFLEAAFWRWCSLRERTLAEFVFPNGIAFSKAWRNIYRNLGIACVATLGAGLVSPIAQLWILGAGIFITVCQALAHLLATGRAFQLVSCSGVNTHLYAGYPIGFRELGVFLFKYSLTQAPALLLFSIISCLLTFHFCGWPLDIGASTGFKIAGLLLASRFLFLTFSFSSGTNDTSRIRLKSLLLIFLAVLFGVAFAGLGAATLLLPNQTAAWLCLIAAPLEAYVFFRVYGWFYNRKVFDLMNLPRH